MRDDLAAAFPGLAGRPFRKAALGVVAPWAASAATVALALSGLAALAMAIAPAGEASGDGAAPARLLPPVLAITTVAEPAPEAPASISANAPAHAPAMPAAAAPNPPPPDPPAPDQPPVDRPTVPQPLVAPASDDPAPRADTPPPADLAKARPKARPKPEDRPDPQPDPHPETRQQAAPAAAPVVPRASAEASVGAGQRAVASYGAAVMQQIRQTRPRRAPASGTVVVRFVIGDSGGLAALSVAKSSGSAALDAVALDHIARAAPFPAPPPGAGRSFAFEFQGR